MSTSTPAPAGRSSVTRHNDKMWWEKVLVENHKKGRINISSKLRARFLLADIFLELPEGRV